MVDPTSIRAALCMNRNGNGLKRRREHGGTSHAPTQEGVGNVISATDKLNGEFGYGVEHAEAGKILGV